MRLSKRFLALAAIVASSVVAAASTPDLRDYPLRVVVFKDSASNHYWDGLFFYSHGHGKANLIDGAHTNAMEFQFRCDGHPEVNEANESYPARWKTPGTQLEVLMGQIGSEHLTKCTMDTTVKPYVYHVRNGERITMTQEQWADWNARNAASIDAKAPADTDYAHYPVQISLMKIDLSHYDAHMYSGGGQGNIADASGALHAVDFALKCPVKVHETPDGRFYHGRWDVQDKQMTILLHSWDDPSKFATCTLQTHVNADIYVRTAAGLMAVSPEKYKALQQAPANVSTNAGGN